ncbi:MAG: YbaB/EbfC family nucleoid-associated protein [Planctomycetes bacterium]|nr:YbaB/EbfC family nucleoid-associated protein [Planctomycetota bacterium]
MNTGFGGMGDLFKQAQKMQKDMARIQKELKERVLEVSGAGGKIKVLVNGQREIVSVKIDPSLVDPQDVDMLEDLLITTTNQALKQAADLQNTAMQRAAGGMIPPGLLG